MNWMCAVSGANSINVHSDKIAPKVSQSRPRGKERCEHNALAKNIGKSPKIAFTIVKLEN